MTEEWRKRILMSTNVSHTFRTYLSTVVLFSAHTGKSGQVGARLRLKKSSLKYARRQLLRTFATRKTLFPT